MQIGVNELLHLVAGLSRGGLQREDEERLPWKVPSCC